METVIRAGRGRDAFLDRQVVRSAQDQLSYDEVGQTGCANLPSGYRHDRVSTHVGAGDQDWEHAKEAIRLWKAHAHARITITPSNALIEQGTTVLASRSLGPVTVIAPCRIVYVTNEPNRFGFAYGTLPGHPEQGEEAFHVVRADDGNVRAEIVAFSRPADTVTRLSGPIAREIQNAVTRRYLEGIQQYVHGSRQFPDAGPLDEDLIGLLCGRDGQETEAELQDGRRCRVLNIAWGYDAGDDYAHVTTNISPSVHGFDVDFFFTNEILRLRDPVGVEVIWQREP